ncbi:MAG: imidazoleglycerol-phosphate dehydratase HisB [Acidobacteria bacterium]|nr:imidazoleglycerol-phosphate dehydratase HisB [Acidobacteriota bacterium]MCZ6876965.1 imidazoleglycerol-phosphate dehydratase HisB [Acidobacteriota bacterium]
MSQRTASVKRETRETKIEIDLNLDGQGNCTCRVGLGFLEHMLELLAAHARIDLKIQAQGDVQVDDHHLTEDLGITLGQAIDKALGTKKGIERYGFVLLPMDEVLVAVAVDLGGRFAFCCNYRPQRELIGDLSTELIPHFFRSLAVAAKCNLHFKFLNRGENEHHRIEAMFKGFARSLRMAVHIDREAKGQIPSTKGVL